MPVSIARCREKITEITVKLRGSASEGMIVFFIIPPLPQHRTRKNALFSR